MSAPRKPRGRLLNGILLLDKPLGCSSNEALQRAKRLFRAEKAGHTGNLDPLATGMLPICFGQATKVSAFLLDADKIYEVRLRLGARTRTGDLEGDVVETGPADPATLDQLRSVLPSFQGEIEQIPPMYSALKRDGQPLYKLARQGIEVDRPARRVTIHELRWLSQPLGSQSTDVDLRVHCSKGTYVRTLVEDIARAAGSCAHVVELRRWAVGPYADDSPLWTFADLEALAETGSASLDACILKTDSALQRWPAVHLSRESAFAIVRGNSVVVAELPEAEWVRLYGPSDDFLGMGEVGHGGKIEPRRMMGATSR